MKRLVFIAALLVITSPACVDATLPAPSIEPIQAAEHTMTAAASLTEPPAPTPVNNSACVPQDTQVDVGIVSRIVDGDTVEAILNGQTFTVRYIGIQAPASNNSDKPGKRFGPEAEALNRQLVEGQVVFLVKDASESDPDGRLLRYVFVGDLSGPLVNYELVRNGYAMAVAQPPDMACAGTFELAQQLAAQESLGIWAPTPLPTFNPFPSSTPPPPAPKPPSRRSCPCKD